MAYSLFFENAKSSLHQRKRIGCQRGNDSEEVNTHTTPRNDLVPRCCKMTLQIFSTRVFVVILYM